MKKILIKKLLIIFFLILTTGKVFSEKNNSIIITVGNYPITRLDLIKEIKFIAVLSNINLNENNKEQVKNLAIQTMVKRAIKNYEINRLNINSYNSKDLERQISIVAQNLGMDKSNLRAFLSERNLNYDDMVESIKVDLKWNTAIFKLYKNKIALNTIEIEDKIKSEIQNFKLDKSILLSEIHVNLSSEGLESTSNKVLKKIKEEGFENAAKNLSISNSAKDGGNLGWIKEKKLSEKIYENVKNLRNGEISKPIVIGDTLVFIKKIDEKGDSPDLEGIKKSVVNQEKMKKLDMYSNSHYSDLERKIKVKFL